MVWVNIFSYIKCCEYNPDLEKTFSIGQVNQLVFRQKNLLVPFLVLTYPVSS